MQERRDEVIRQLDGQLQQHERFGHSGKIVRHTVERYRFALELIATRDEHARELAQQIETLDETRADRLFGDFLVRIEMEAAIGRLENGDVTPSSSRGLLEVLDGALSTMWEHPGDSLSGRQMSRRFVVGPEKRTWVWDISEDDATPHGHRMRERLRTHFMPGSGCGFELVRPTPRMVEQLDRACTLLFRLLPEVAGSIFAHLHSIAIGHIRGPGGRRLTGSGDATPCTIFLDPHELENPWDTAGHIVHEGSHLKLVDATRTGHLADEGLVELPWRSPCALSKCVYAFHAYVHLQLFRTAVERLGPAHHAEFGAPSEYHAPAHAMSVVHNATGPFSRAEQRLEHYRQQLQGAWGARVTPSGREMIQWAWDTIRPIVPSARANTATATATPCWQGDRPVVPARAPSSARYRRDPSVLVRRSPACEVLFALAPRTRKIVTMNLPAWLAFELCDGRTEQELLSAFAAPRGLAVDVAWAQLAAALKQLEASGMIVPAAPASLEILRGAPA